MNLDECITGGRVWRDGAVVDNQVTASDLHDHRLSQDEVLWVDLLRPPKDAFAELGRHLDLPATTIEDALSPNERPKVTQHEATVFFTVLTAIVAPEPASASTGRIQLARISGIVTPRALITIRLDDDVDPAPIVAHWDDNPELLRYGSWALLHGVLDAVVDGYFSALHALDDAVEQIEDQLFSDRPPGRDFTAEMFRLRKDVARMRRAVVPMRDVVTSVQRYRPRDGSDLDHWYDDLYDHALRSVDDADTMRELLGTMYETNLNLQDNRLNVIMKKLAAWGAIIAVPTAITGWYGQNLPYPGYNTAVGVWASIALILAIGGLLYGQFKRRDWL